VEVGSTGSRRALGQRVSRKGRHSGRRGTPGRVLPSLLVVVGMHDSLCRQVRLELPCLLVPGQIAQVVQVLRPADCPLVLHQGVEPYEGDSEFTVFQGQNRLDAALPRFLECDAADRVDQIDAIRRLSELHDRAIRRKVGGGGEAGHIPVPESVQRSEEPLEIGGVATEEEVDVTRQSHVSVEDDRLATHDQVADVVRVKEPDEVASVGREVRSVYSDGWHSRTSFASGGNARSLRMRAARMRSSGVIAVCCFTSQR
jgi:hypothetical protein